MKTKMKVLGISGSLRDGSVNTSILKAFSLFLPNYSDFSIFTALGELPHFSPEREINNAVTALKNQILEADAVVICTPEYAFGVPGVLKNALDWTVSTGEFNDKPIVAISASPLNSGGDKALASLLLTLTALGTRKNENSSLSIPNVKLRIRADGTITDQVINAQLQELADNLLKIID